METREAKEKELLERGVLEIIDKNHLKERIKTGEKLRIKFGIDPTTPDLHLGHVVPLFKLRQFQELNHQIVLIIGDFTAMIGDPSGRSEERKPLTEKEVKANLKTYLAQAGKIIDIKKTEVHYNSRWLKKLRGADFLHLLSQATSQQILEREDFHQRFLAHKPIGLHELIYPLLQAYDSVMVKADVEIGGSDQKFNLLTGRMLMKKFNLPPQDIMTLPLLVGLDGVRKMSKSFGNYIPLNAPPDEMFGKIMAIPDNLMAMYFDLLTKIPSAEINKLEKELPPAQLKRKLALNIVKEIYGEKKAKEAAVNFDLVFKKHELPAEAPTIKAKRGDLIIDIILKSGLAASKSEIKRLMNEGAIVDFKNEKISDYNFRLKKSLDLKIGKRRFLRIFVD